MVVSQNDTKTLLSEPPCLDSRMQLIRGSLQRRLERMDASTDAVMVSQHAVYQRFEVEDTSMFTSARLHDCTQLFQNAF